MNRFQPRLRVAALVLTAVTAAAVAAGCAAPAAPSPAPAASGTAATTPATAAPTSAASGSSAASTSPANCNAYASSLKPLPGSLQMPAGSFMAKIKARGHLVAGVDANTYRFEYWNSRQQAFEGFDIDMIRAVAQAIFGNPNDVQYKAITNTERATDLKNGTVDIVAHTYTINCDHLKDVAFSTVYYEAHRQVLVLDSSRAKSLNDLAGQPVCATASSDAIASIQSAHATVITRPYITDCLVLLQQGQVAAIVSDSSILQSLKAQDPYTTILPGYLTDEPYGLAIAKTNTDFVRFVNAVLQDVRTSGAWNADYANWFGTPVPHWPTVGYAS
jgi:polar amino acid transport system substrate-binding protein